jgi:hypothetical protein
VAVRLFAILARAARRAVVLRRGPSNRVLLLSWRTDVDAFEPGQWLKGRIYERRCDLSPSGVRLAYFAASWKKPYQSWTAISNPPWLTAIALWPKGNAWGGGALFDDETHVALNHFAIEREMTLAEGLTLPRAIVVAPMGAQSGRGEDGPIWFARLMRDGWTRVQDGVRHENEYLKSEVWFVFDPPEVWSRPSPTRPKHVLRMMVHGIKRTDGPWWNLEHEVIDGRGGVFSIGESDWADWDVNGDLLFAKEGMIFRARSIRGIDVMDVREIADLRAMKYEEKRAPAAARRW